MTLAPSQTRFAPDDLLHVGGDGLYELVDGQLVEKRMSTLSSRTAGLITGRLFVHIAQSGGGALFPEHAFQCFPDDSELIRRPDIAYIVAERLVGMPDEGNARIAPDLAIEIISPNDKVYELDLKLGEYRSAGVRLMWVVNPQARVIRVHRADLSVSELFESDTITGESVLPGFSIAVRDLFPSQPAPRAV